MSKSVDDWPRLERPELDLSDPRGPRSALFGDGYASAAGAIDEGEAVFLQGIGAPEIWAARDPITIGETGFGLGVNFLLTWRAWRETCHSDTARLDYISVEAYPLDHEELRAALACFTPLAPFAEALIAAWPPRHKGIHRLSFEEGRITLILILGEAAEMLGAYGQRSDYASIDAWYLDGFAPACNQSLWSPEVFQGIARLSAPGAPFATYTAAGAVKRGLQEVGFTVEKKKGFAGKRERLTGYFTGSQTPTAAPPTAEEKEAKTQTAKEEPWYAPPSPLRQTCARPHAIAVIGAGIAGLCVADALQAQGTLVTLFDPAPENGLSGLEKGVALLAPKLPAKATRIGRLQCQALLNAAAFYDGLMAFAEVWESRGVTQIAPNPQEAARQDAARRGLDWPETFLRHEIVDGQDGDAIGLHFPTIGAVSPKAVQEALCARTGLAMERKQIDAWQRDPDGGWHLFALGEKVWHGDAVVFASGAWTETLLSSNGTRTALSIHPNRGQISVVAAHENTKPGAANYGGYAGPITDGMRVIGSSFQPWENPSDTAWQDWREEDHKAYGSDYARFAGGSVPEALTGWVGLRATTPDRLPLLGALPDFNLYQHLYDGLRTGKKGAIYPHPPYQNGLYVLSGMGARGYLYAPLLGESLARMILGRPPILESDLLDALHPARFLIRAMKRNIPL